MRKPITILIALALAAAFPCGAPAAGTGPLSADAELASGDWTALAKRYPMPYFFSSDGDAKDAPSPEVLATWWDVLGDETLSEEVFGPLGLVVIARDAEEMTAVAAALHGQLTCTLHLDAADSDLARRLLPILERKAGRILANGFPTGVEVADAMVHGGPYPASTNFGATSVGTLSIRRFLRPVCYQNLPQDILPSDLL